MSRFAREHQVGRNRNGEHKGTEAEWNAIEYSNRTGLYERDVTTLYFYLETAPQTAGNYWRYVNNEPTAWELDK